MTTATVTFADVVAILLAGAGEFQAGGHSAGCSLLEHGLQCAHLLASRRPDDVELQVAGLFHDIGHTLTGNDETAHSEAAARVLEPILGRRVANLVRLHVPAKRYLVAADTNYASVLSPASRGSLAAQGGEMSDRERRQFDELPDAFDAVVLRRCDDLAQVPGAPVDPIVEWLPRIQRLAQTVDSVGDRH